MIDDRSRKCLASVWAGAGLDVGELEAVQITGCDPTLPSAFRVGEVAAASVAAAGAAAAQLWRLRSGIKAWSISCNAMTTRRVSPQRC